MPETLSTEDFEQHSEEFGQIFAEDGIYFSARNEVIEAEVFLGGTGKSFLLELRDAFDHLANAVLYRGERRKYVEQVLEMRTHLSRIRNEASEYRCENAIDMADKGLLYGTWWWRFLGITPELSPKAMRGNINRAKELLAKGRSDKGARIRPYECFTESRQLCERVNKDLRAADRWGKPSAVIIGIILLFIGGLLSKYLFP